ncbi:MAG TPA: RraA family protein [Planctomycetota bacterium]|nr:RraA family protein [Planctomycetota bacterium]
MKAWSCEDELFSVMRRELFTAVVGDCMDKLGLRRQFLPPQIRPLRDDMIVVGRAMPVLEADFFGECIEGGANPLLAQPFGLMFRALDDLKANEVYICTGSSPAYALWGELMSTRALKLKAAGAVLDGYSRDTRGVLRLNFPTFSYGSYAQDQGPRGKVVDFRVPIEIGGVRVATGDIVFGDIDGVCIVPRAAEEEVIHRALEKARGEKRVQKAIEDGMSTVEAYATFGIM